MTQHLDYIAPIALALIDDLGTKGKASPATVQQLAAFEFRSIKAIRRMSKADRIANAHGLADKVRRMAVVAGEICANEKAELVQKVAARHDIFGPFLMELADANQDAKALVELIGAAEVRLASPWRWQLSKAMMPRPIDRRFCPPVAR